MSLDSKHITFCSAHASIPEIVASIDTAVSYHDEHARQWLRDFLFAEKAGKNRKAVVARITEVLAAWDDADEPPAPQSAIANRQSAIVEGKAAVLKQDDLPSLAAGIEFAQTEIDEIGRKAMQQALPLKLKQGLFCLKAQALFALTPTERASLGGKAKAALSDSDQAGADSLLSDSDNSSDEPSDTPASFSDWIACQPVAKATAYDLMHAVEGLGLDHQADEKALAKAYDTARKAAEAKGETLSIAKLKHLALANKQPAEQEPEETPDPAARAAEARAQAVHFIGTWDRSVKAGNLEHADTDTLKQLHEFLTTARDHVGKRLKGSAK